jgi:hypothetical protein
MGPETAHGHLKQPFHVATFFEVNSKLYYYTQNLDTKFWYIQELLPGGRMGKKTTNGTWRNSYDVLFVSKISDKSYIFAKSY